MRDPAHERARLAAALAAASPGESGSPGRPDEHPDDVALALYLAGALDPQATEAFERHVAGCARCAADVATAARVECSARADSAAPADSAARVGSAPPDEIAARSGASTPSRRDRIAAAPSRDAARSPARAAGLPRPRRRLRRLALAASVVLIATAGLLALGGRMALDRLKPVLVAELSRALERDVAAERLALAFGGGPGIAVDGLRIADDARFSQASFVTAGRAALSVDVAALMRGELDGSIAVDDAVVRLVRGPGGVWNVQSLGDRSGGHGPAGPASLPRPAAGERERVRLTSVAVRDGRLEIADRSGAAARELVVRDLELDVQSPDASRPARVKLDGVVGSEADARKVAIDGEVGPFTRGQSPRWQLSNVSLDRIPVDDIPGAPASLRGELSFSGSLESSGDAVDAVVANARGSGELGVCCGRLVAGNLGRDVVAALGSDLTGRANGTAFSDAVAVAAAREPAVAAALAAPETAFRNVGGSVVIAADALAFRDLTLSTSLFTADSAGTISRGGAVQVSGSLALEPAFAAVVAQAAPALRPLVDGAGKLALPFRASGTWPRIAVAVDLARAVAAARHLDPRALAFSLASGRGVGAPFAASDRAALLARLAG